MPSKSKPRLSRGVLDMKFMQRTKVKVEKEADDEQSRALYSNEINQKMLNSTSNFVVESSYSICAGLIDGRLSFRGMNPELELHGAGSGGKAGPHKAGAAQGGIRPRHGKGLLCQQGAHGLRQHEQV